MLKKEIGIKPGIGSGWSASAFAWASALGLRIRIGKTVKVVLQWHIGAWTSGHADQMLIKAVAKLPQHRWFLANGVVMKWMEIRMEMHHAWNREWLNWTNISISISISTSIGDCRCVDSILWKAGKGMQKGSGWTAAFAFGQCGWIYQCWNTTLKIRWDMHQDQIGGR